MADQLARYHVIFILVKATSAPGTAVSHNGAWTHYQVAD
jgi:hypothetical protein